MSNNPLYSIREAGERWVDLDNIYAPYEGLFSFKIHHGGFFTPKPGINYMEGNIDHADCVNIDLFSVHEMDSIMEDLGYTGRQVMLYFFLKPGFELDDGLHPLSSDQDVIKLSEYVGNNRLISIYIEHGKSKNIGYFSPTLSKKLVIQDIDDDDSEPIKPKPKPKPKNKSGFRKLLLDWDEEPVLTPNSQQNDSNANKGKEPLVEDDRVDGNTVFEDDIFDGIGDDGNAVEVDDHDDGNAMDDDEVHDHNNDSCFADNEASEDSEDSEDSDYIVDEQNEIHEVEVDMRDFDLHVDPNVEYMGPETGVGTSVETGGDEDIEVINNDDFESGSDPEDDVNRDRNRLLKSMGKIRPTRDANTFKAGFHVTQTFGNKAEVLERVKRHAIESRRQLKIIKNDNERVRVICEGRLPVFDPIGSGNVPQNDESIGPVKDGPSKSRGPKKNKLSSSCGPSQNTKSKKADKNSGVVGEDSNINKGGRGKKTNPNQYPCPWSLQVSKLVGSETWMVKTHTEEHQCLQSRIIKHLTSKFLGSTIVQQIEGNPDIPSSALQQELQMRFRLGLSKQKAQRAKKAAKGQLRGDYTKQYNLLRDYVQELMTSNPGTTVRLDVLPPNHEDEPTRVFKRIYICLGALKRGFKSAGRELIGLDGAFTSGPFPGQVLTAVSLDSNNGIYPIAYALVEAETTDSWMWFLTCLGEDLDLEPRSNYTFISDRQKGIISALARVYPNAEQRFCLKHIHENMKLQWRGTAYKNHLWKCATVTTVPEFTKAMLEFKSFSEPAYNWLAKIPPRHWTRSHFTGRAKSDVLLNNMCEVFNSKTVDGRDKPIIHCLEYIREYLMIRIGNVQKVIDKCTTVLTPTTTKLLEIQKVEASKYKAIFNGIDKFQVSGAWGDQCVVDITNMSCSCRKWEITGIPCKHAVAANWNMGENTMPVGLIETWVDPIYRTDTWKLMYHFKITPTNGMNMWAKCDVPTMIIPPYYHTPVGRPKKKRRKTAEEIQLVKKGKLTRRLRHVVCNKCGGMGHNKRTCKIGSGGLNEAGGPSGQAGGPSGQAGGPSVAGGPSGDGGPRQNVADCSSQHSAPTQSQTGSSAGHNARQTAPSSPSYRTASTLVKSPGGSKW